MTRSIAVVASDEPSHVGRSIMMDRDGAAASLESLTPSEAEISYVESQLFEDLDDLDRRP